mmetsp:Transcript_43761/g.136877  ORF Transcript_43761/g.136877 Transcript_43761/m.136877 type:complete len:409 (-) Transcript_43761:31-1257(-)
MPRRKEQPNLGSGVATPEKRADKRTRANGGGGIFCKTKMCRFNILGICTKGPECPYAHAREELKPPPDLYRTKVCKNLIGTGRCEDPDCRYAHSKDQLRTTTTLKKGSKATAPGQVRPEPLQADPGWWGSSHQLKPVQGSAPEPGRALTKEPTQQPGSGGGGGGAPGQVPPEGRAQEQPAVGGWQRAGEPAQEQPAVGWQAMKQVIPMASAVPAATGPGTYAMLLQAPPFNSVNGGIAAVNGLSGTLYFQSRGAGDSDAVPVQMPCFPGEIPGVACAAVEDWVRPGPGPGGSRGWRQGKHEVEAAASDGCTAEEEEEEPVSPRPVYTARAAMKPAGGVEAPGTTNRPRGHTFAGTVMASESPVDMSTHYTVKNTFLDFGPQTRNGFEASDAHALHAWAGLLFSPTARG